MRRSATRRLWRLNPRAFGALASSALDLSPLLQMLHPPLTDTGQLTVITQTKLTLTLALTLTHTVTVKNQTKLTLTLTLTLTDTVMVIIQSKLSIYLSIYLYLFVA